MGAGGEVGRGREALTLSSVTAFLSTRYAGGSGALARKSAICVFGPVRSLACRHSSCKDKCGNIDSEIQLALVNAHMASIFLCKHDCLDLPLVHLFVCERIAALSAY